MTTAIFNKLVLSAATETPVGTIPSALVFATVTVNILNTANTPASINLAIVDGSGTPVPADYIDKGTIVPANGGVALRSCILVPAGSTIFATSDQAGTVVNVSGLGQEA